MSAQAHRTGMNMRIIRFSELHQMPWKSGGGITREIAVARAGEALIWRLSIADVGVDGPFSKFEGLQRILTVIEGRGVELIAQHETLQADYAVPVRFDGGWDVQSKLKDGPLRDLNLIYNPTLCTGDVVVLGGGTRILHATPRQIYAIHCLKGTINLSKTEQFKIGDTALLEAGSLQLVIDEGASALLISMAIHS